MNKEEAKFGEITAKEEGATLCRYCYCNIRKPLTDEEIGKIVAVHAQITDQNLSGAIYMAMRDLEAAHGIGEEND